MRASGRGGRGCERVVDGIFVVWFLIRGSAIVGLASLDVAVEKCGELGRLGRRFEAFFRGRDDGR